MNIKSESEIKIEELDLEYDSYQQDFQIFSDNESDFTLKAEDIKIEEIVEKVSIKSELTESKMESMLGEGQVNTGVIKSENVMMIEEKSCGQHSKIFPSKEGSLASAEGIKNEESDEKTLRESEKEFIFVELINQDVIKSENQMMVEKKFCSQNLKKFITLKIVSSLLNKVNDESSEAQFESDEERFSLHKL
ncbi:UNVERIFIED_CONTAM: hypothetical protein RMT77_018553 [Armadillidium vulgare]